MTFVMSWTEAEGSLVSSMMRWTDVGIGGSSFRPFKISSVDVVAMSPAFSFPLPTHGEPVRSMGYPEPFPRGQSLFSKGFGYFGSRAALLNRKPSSRAIGSGQERGVPHTQAKSSGTDCRFLPAVLSHGTPVFRGLKRL